LHAWLLTERSRDHVPRSHHDTLAWVRLAAGGVGSDEASIFSPAPSLWQAGLAADDCLDRAGYYRVTGQFQPEPLCHGYWGIVWTFEPLIRFEEI